MALPGDLNTITVTGKYLDSSGAPLSGSITFAPSTTLTDATGTVVIPAYGRTYPLSGSGAFTTDPLVATDDTTLSPSGWTYTVTLALQNLQQSSWSVLIPHNPFAFTATNATPCVFTATGSAYANGTAVSLAGSPPTGFTAGTTYFVVSASGATFRLAATSGGSAIASTSTGSGTVSTASADISALTPVVSQGTPVAYVPSTGGTYTGTVEFDGSPALRVPSGAASGQVLTSDSSGNAVWAAPALVVKPSVQEATAAALPSNTYLSGVLTAAGNGALTVDGIAVTAGDRVLVKNEATAANNGVYVATSAGGVSTPYVLTRAADMNTASQVPGAFVFAEQGTANGNTGWIVSGIGPWTIGTTAVSWTQFSATPSAQLLTPTAVKTANYTAAAGDLVKTDTSGGSFTVTLPTTPPVNTTIGIKQVTVAGVGTNATTVTAGGSDVFNKSGGPASFTIDRLNQTVILQYGSGGIWTVESTDDATNQIALSRQGVYYLDSYTGTDDAKMTSALTALFAASPAGGTIVLSPRAHTFANQWTTSYSAGVATAVKIQGAGVAYNGAWGTPAAATTCDLQYNGAGAARLDFQHIGSIEITGILFKDTVTSTVPFILTTNATPNIHDNVFLGSVSGTAASQDVIVLGGTGSSVGSGDTAPYQGYQGQVYRNFFHKIRRAVLVQTFANSVYIHGNTISSSCGSNLSLGACFECNPGSGSLSGVIIRDNLVEITAYPVGVKCANTLSSTLGPNAFWDPVVGIIACAYYLAASSTYNLIVDGYRADSAVPLVFDVSGNNTVQTAHDVPERSVTTQYSDVRNDMMVKSSTISGAGPLSVSPQGELAFVSAIHSGVNPIAQIGTVTSTSVADGTTVSGSRYITSVTAAFVAADIGLFTSGGPAGWIAAVFSPTTAIKWYPSTAYAAGDIGRPTTANAHLYQVSTAGTSGSSQPTWPTSGGTVTDGTAVWTDLGTSATAALVSANAAAGSTASGVTIFWGRRGATQLQTQFGKGHIISVGTAPAVAANAAAGTSPTISVTGTDTAMLVNLTEGTSPPAGGDLFTVTFNLSFGAAPKPDVVAMNSATATLLQGGFYFTSATGTLKLSVLGTPSAAAAYVFSIKNIQ